MSPLETKMRKMVAVLDASALEALANKGLLRRAQKDLERGVEVKVLGETPGLLRLGVAGFEIQLPETGPASARCSCPATGVCQHILAALLFLQKDAGDNPVASGNLGADPGEPRPSSGTAAIETELMTLNAETLTRWAGKPAFGAGLKLAFEGPVELLREGLLKIRIPHANAEVHFLPGGGLDGAIVSGTATRAAALIVASVVGLQRAAGVTWEAPSDWVGTYRADGAPRSRREVLESCQSLLSETGSIGLSRLSKSNLERWRTLGVSAVGVHLPRLALVLRGISDEVSLLLMRDARAESARLLRQMAQAHALCTALARGGESPRPDWVGSHRARYTDVGNLDLAGVSAWPWKTASGYCGLTVLFWDVRGRQWNTWSESRPSHQKPEFDPVKRFTQPGPWEGADSPRRLTRGSFRLHHAKRSGARRLSGSSGSRVLMTSDAGDLDKGIPVFEEWEALEMHWASHRSVGLKEENPLDFVVVLKPALWGRREFDSIRQNFQWVVGDTRQTGMALTLPYASWSERAIQQLEALRPEELLGARVLGRLQRSGRDLSVQPYSIHWEGGKTLLLGLDTVVASSPPAAVTGTEAASQTGGAELKSDGSESEDESDLEIGDAVELELELELNPIVGQLLADVDDVLLAIAEGGSTSHRGPHLLRLESLVSQCGRFGLKGLGVGLQRVWLNPRDPVLLLRCVYATQVYRGASR